MVAHKRPRLRWIVLSSLAVCGTRVLSRGGVRLTAGRTQRDSGEAFAAPRHGQPSAARNLRRCAPVFPELSAQGAARAEPGSSAPLVQLLFPAAAAAAAAVALRGSTARQERVVPRRASGGEKDVRGAVAVEEEAEPFFEEVQGDDPIVLELEDRLRKMNGNPELTLDMVLNPGTIVNVEREVILLRAELKATPEEDAEKRKQLEDKIEQKQMKIVNEMRQVMTDGLKAEFVLQALLNVVLCGALCYGLIPREYLPDLSWAGLTPAGVELVGKLYGIWGLWLLTVPALRARKPGGPFGMGYEEKRALDLSFLVLPFICIFTPFFSRDPTVTFWLSLVGLGSLYAWSYSTPLEGQTGPRRGAGSDLNLPEPVQWALKALDFGTGEERGARSEDTTWQDQLAKYEAEAERLAAEKMAKPTASSENTQTSEKQQVS